MCIYILNIVHDNLRHTKWDIIFNMNLLTLFPNMISTQSTMYNQYLSLKSEFVKLNIRVNFSPNRGPKARVRTRSVRNPRSASKQSALINN